MTSRSRKKEGSRFDFEDEDCAWGCKMAVSGSVCCCWCANKGMDMWCVCEKNTSCLKTWWEREKEDLSVKVEGEEGERRGR